MRYVKSPRLNPSLLLTPAAGWRTVRMSVVLVAAVLSASPVLADEDPPEASKSLLSDGKTPAHCKDADSGHPHNHEGVCNTDTVKDLRSPNKRTDSGNAELASKLANPSAPVLALTTFWSIISHGGSAEGAHRSSFELTIQPSFGFQTFKGNMLLRPAVTVQFGQPFLTADGDVDTAVQFGNIQLDSVFGKTFKSGLIFMGGANTTFPTASKRELRADWTFGPEIIIGYASAKTGNLWGSIIGYFWSFDEPTNAQTVGGQYFYAINLGPQGWQLSASPFWSYNRDANLLSFPLGLGIAKTGAVGKKNFPLKVKVELWGYIPPPDASGPEWQVRIEVTPIFKRPWQQNGAGTMRNRRRGGG
ncbi:MAG: hypothetical protein KJO57_01355 [Deltaproteobacteria bacterium]|nr:hypothetical protein [Deltaproteobacteria bacterium]NNK08473.1 hypothetical protein [Myxococcales bacterium]NNK41380.1 hypothetical protein [Myxococcales bacterium]